MTSQERDRWRQQHDQDEEPIGRTALALIFAAVVLIVVSLFVGV